FEFKSLCAFRLPHNIKAKRLQRIFMIILGLSSINGSISGLNFNVEVIVFLVFKVKKKQCVVQFLI
ncbi:MAG: hypothetical protein AAF688_12470, partial [Bacteroidota bacterium]